MAHVFVAVLQAFSWAPTRPCSDWAPDLLEIYIESLAPVPKAEIRKFQSDVRAFKRAPYREKEPLLPGHARVLWEQLNPNRSFDEFRTSCEPKDEPKGRKRVRLSAKHEAFRTHPSYLEAQTLLNAYRDVRRQTL